MTALVDTFLGAVALAHRSLKNSFKDGCSALTATEDMFTGSMCLLKLSLKGGSPIATIPKNTIFRGGYHNGAPRNTF